MTVRDWIVRRTEEAQPALTERMLSALGPDAELDAARTAELCLSAATRSLDALLSENRFGRDSAIDLLTVDALATLAFEHACESAVSEEQLTALAKHGARLLGQLTTQRV